VAAAQAKAQAEAAASEAATAQAATASRQAMSRHNTESGSAAATSGEPDSSTALDRFAARFRGGYATFTCTRDSNHGGSWSGPLFWIRKGVGRRIQRACFPQPQHGPRWTDSCR
jgi:hypothetical protein